MSDAHALIAAYCRDGDNEAFRRFYRSHAPRLWKFLVARGCHPDTAYDLLAEAFLRFVQSVCRDPRAPVALLYRIALNLRIDAYRREKASPAEAIDDPDRLPAAVGDEAEDHVYVRALVKTLPVSEQNLLLLRYWIGLSHKETAEVLDMPEGTVRRQCAEVLQKLRERWREDEGRYATG